MLLYGGRYALVAWAMVRGGDVYLGHMSGSVPGFKQSYHASGQTHIKAAGTLIRESVSRGVPLTETEGWARIGQGRRADLSDPAWQYRPKPNSATRRTLIVDGAKVVDLLWNVWTFAVQPGREDLFPEVLTPSKGVVLIEHTIMDWTNPMVVMTVIALSPDAQVALDEAMSREGDMP